MSPDDARHGTVAGYLAHRKADQAACDDCKRAAAQYQDRRAYEREKGEARTVDPRGVKRRIQALMALGWTAGHIAEAAGLNSPEAVHRLRFVTFVRRDMFDKIDAAYEALSGRPGPSAITRGRAVAAGYAPPLAWDCIDADAEPSGVSERPVLRIQRTAGTYDSAGYHACPRCGIVREARSASAPCVDCREHVEVAA